MNNLQIESNNRMINYHGLMQTIDFFLELLYKALDKPINGRDYDFIIKSLNHCRLKLIANDSLDNPPF